MPPTVLNVLSTELARKMKASTTGDRSNDKLFDAVDASGFSAEPWKVRNNADDGNYAFPALKPVRDLLRDKILRRISGRSSDDE